MYCQNLLPVLVKLCFDKQYCLKYLAHVDYSEEES